MLASFQAGLWLSTFASTVPSAWNALPSKPLEDPLSPLGFPEVTISMRPCLSTSFPVPVRSSDIAHSSGPLGSTFLHHTDQARGGFS